MTRRILASAPWRAARGTSCGHRSDVQRANWPEFVPSGAAWLHIAVLAALVTGASGCEMSETEPTTLAVTGFVVKTGPGTYDLVDMEAQEIADELVIREHEKIITGQYILAHVEGEGPLGAYDFDVLFGPDFGVPGEEGQVYYDPTNGFYLSSGWALLKGMCPLGQTQRTQVAAGGTTLLIHVDNTGSTLTDRIYMLASGSGTNIYVKPTESPVTRSFEGATPFQYLTNTSRTGPVTPVTGTPVSIADSAGTPTEWAFLMRVKEVADVVGMWPP